MSNTRNVWSREYPFRLKKQVLCRPGLSPFLSRFYSAFLFDLRLRQEAVHGISEMDMKEIIMSRPIVNRLSRLFPKEACVRRGFTLVEMLMVLAIFGIMLGMAVAVWDGIGQGTELEAATTELKNTFLLARQYAITKRQAVYVVFPATDSLVFAGGVSNAAYQSYALCTTNEFIRDWSFLPQGIYFDRNYRNNINSIFTAQQGGTNVWGVSIPALWSGPQPAIVFLPNGSILNRNMQPEIALGEGSKFDPGTVPVMQGPTRNKIRIYGFTGMPQMMRLDDAQ